MTTHMTLFSPDSVITVNHNTCFKLHHFLPSADWLAVMVDILYHQTKWQTIMCSSCEQQPEPESHWDKRISLDSRTFNKFWNSRTLNSDFSVWISFVLCWVTREFCRSDVITCTLIWSLQLTTLNRCRNEPNVNLKALFWHHWVDIYTNSLFHSC